MLTPERFWAKVNKTNGCWYWQGEILWNGYGRTCHKGKLTLVHRYVYGLEIGPIPEGIYIDHTCHNADKSCPGGIACLHRRCVRPDHLGLTTNQENCRRGQNRQREKTHCRNGHLYNTENTRWIGNERRCRICTRAHRRRSYYQNLVANRAYFRNKQREYRKFNRESIDAWRHNLEQRNTTPFQINEPLILRTRDG